MYGKEAYEIGGDYGNHTKEITLERLASEAVDSKKRVEQAHRRLL